jgi:hypothetical protein
MGSGPLCDLNHATRSPGQPPVREAGSIEPNLQLRCKLFASNKAI